MNWANLQTSLSGINFSTAANVGQAAAKFTRHSLQQTKERLGQINADDITELPQGGCYKATKITFAHFCCSEYKDLEARCDALRAAHQALLKYVVESSRHRLPPELKHPRQDYQGVRN